MPVTIQCSACGTRYSAPDNLIGKSTKCSACGRTITVAVPAGPGQSVANPSTAAYCRGCGEGFAATKDLWGKKVKCPKCGNVIAVPNPQVSPAVPSPPRREPLDNVLNMESSYGATPGTQPSRLGNPFTPEAYKALTPPKPRGPRFGNEVKPWHLAVVGAVLAGGGALICGIKYGRPLGGAGMGLILTGMAVAMTGRKAQRFRQELSMLDLLNVFIGIGILILGLAIAFGDSYLLGPYEK